MGKTTDFKKISDTKGTFHAKMGTIKDRNCKDITEKRLRQVDRICRRTLQKDLNDLDNHDSVVTDLEPDILGHAVK